MSPTRRYRFADVEIDLDAREIRRAGRRADVEAKVFDLIELLLLARGRALTKTELTSALWADRPVTDAALSQQLRKARRALGDDGDAQRVIRTVHGRGLVWVAEIVNVGDSVEDASDPAIVAPVATVAAIPRPVTEVRPRPKRWLAVAAAGVLLLVGAIVVMRYPIRAAGDPDARARIAVLPIADRTGEPDLAWTAAGLMGLMTSLLEQSGRIEVVSAQNVEAVKGANGAIDPAVVRRALGATHFVSGELRRVGPIYELDLKLIAAGAAERHEVLHGSAPAPLAVDGVARVQRWLDLTPLPDTRTSGIASPFLAEAYARGLDAQLHGDHAGARKYFEICLDHDPGLAWPRLGLAVSQAASGDETASDENAAKVVAAARERNDRELLVPALRQRASVAYHRGDLDGATGLLDEALAGVSAADQPLAMSELLVGYASIEDDRGDFAKARAHFEQALALARSTGNRRAEANVLANLASIDNGAGDAAGAGTKLRDALEAARAGGDAALEGSILGNLGATEANQGRLLAAAALLKQGLALARERGDTRLEALIATQLVWVLTPFDRDREARALAERVIALGEAERNTAWQAEAHWALAALAARRHEWTGALAEYGRARAIYAEDGTTRSLAPLLAELVATASDAGDAAAAREAATAFRAIAVDSPEWQAWLPLLDANLAKAGGDAPGAADALGRVLDAKPAAPGPVAQAALFQLGRWQLALGRADALLARPEWQPLLDQHPEAIADRVAALRATGQTALADAEQQRLDQLRSAPELDLDPAWLAGN
ncbi:MAG TPA: winged helix-turn-helix domain-containing protein [Rhodanobacteraceae bacterium]|nr:winged helix-turn-helix domain-containing protein [Rhodanobacteraceae bacterium]